MNARYYSHHKWVRRREKGEEETKWGRGTRYARAVPCAQLDDWSVRGNFADWKCMTKMMNQNNNHNINNNNNNNNIIKRQLKHPQPYLAK